MGNITENRIFSFLKTRQLCSPYFKHKVTGLRSQNQTKHSPCERKEDVYVGYMTIKTELKPHRRINQMGRSKVRPNTVQVIAQN